MEKKTFWHCLHSGLPPYTSEEADREQWESGPKVLDQSLATSLVRQSEATQAERTSDDGQPD